LAVWVLIAAAVYVFLWLRHRLRNPELLAGRLVPGAPAQAPQAAPAPPAIGPPVRCTFTWTGWR